MHAWELEIIQQIHTYRTHFLDVFFRLLNFVDTPPFFMLLIPFIWFGYDRKIGVNFFLIIMLSGWMNHTLKHFFEWPRPWHLDPELCLIPLKSYGFPSGAAQGAMLLGLLIMSFRKWWSWMLGISYIALVSFSRIYLGVHFFTDILGGWCVGILLYVIYTRGFPVLEEKLQNASFSQKVFLSAASSGLLLLLLPTSFTLDILSILAGLLVGYQLSSKRETPSELTAKALNAFIAIFGIFIFHSLLPSMLAGFASGIWLMVGVDIIIKKPLAQSLIIIFLWGQVMASPFVAPSDPILTQVAPEVPLDQIASKDIQDTIDHMLFIACGEQSGPKSHSIMVGLAAPQIGISKRIILVDTGADGRGDVSDLREYINPEILELTGEKEAWYEGCYSTGRVTGIVYRPRDVKIAAYKRDGTRVIESYSGYVARIFQHEIDHLDGKVFVDRIKNDEDLHIVKEGEMGEYRNQEKWRNWPCKCTRDEWRAIRAN